MIKKIKAVALSILVFSLCFAAFPLVGCNSQLDAKSKYAITATYYENEKRIDATMIVEYVNSAAIELDSVMFHLYPRAFREGARFPAVSPSQLYDAYPLGMSYGDISILKVVRDGEEQDITIVGEDEDILRVDGAIKPHASATIEIDFLLRLPTVRHRFGLFDGIVNLGNWYPIACIVREGKYDATPYYSNGDPFNSDIADYDVSISVPEKFKVATSGRQTESKSNGTKTVRAKIENARDLAAVIGQFNVISKTHNGVLLNYYYRSDMDPPYQLGTAADALDTYSEMFGAYIYDSLSVVKTPFLHGGMEYPALIYISDELNQSLFTEVIAHETAHQWWYAAVGSDQIREAWLDEGLTEYTTTLFYEFNPSYGVTRNERLADAMSAYILFCERYKNNGKDDTSMNRSVAQFSTALEYSFLTYVKGELMIDTLRESIGDKAFFEGLKIYYRENKLGRAACDDFIGAFEAASRTNLKGFFNSWLTGKVKMFAA
ncbi:MAG: M1 family metallopeptidase [Firmicutes bacterium]|nr:M1 family metallopeptidase [Bacillota bacterium]